MRRQIVSVLILFLAAVLIIAGLGLIRSLWVDYSIFQNYILTMISFPITAALFFTFGVHLIVIYGKRMRR